MADMLLFPYELEPGGLPDRCIVCGAESCTPVRHEFRVRFGESNYRVVKVQHLRMREGWVPLCQRHRRHFLSPWFALLGGCGTFAASFLLMGLVGFWTATRSIIALGIIVAGVVGSVLVALFIRNRAVHEIDVTDQGVHMKNLSEMFVEAVKAAREKRRQDVEAGVALAVPSIRAPRGRRGERNPLTLVIVAIMVPFLILTLVGGGLGASAVYKLVFWDRTTAVHAWDETLLLTRGNDSRVMTRRHYNFTRKDGVSTDIEFLDDSHNKEQAIEIRYSSSARFTPGLPYDSSNWDRESSVRVMLYAGLAVAFVGLLPCLVGAALLFFVRTGAAPLRRPSSPRRGRCWEDEKGGEYLRP
jgi:hypothetical protein